MGKNILITGATDGIGKQTAIQLAKMGNKIFIHGRSKEKCEAAVVEISKAAGASEIYYFAADFSDLDQVRDMAEKINSELEKLDVLINNAGIYAKERKLSAQNYELTFAVNHLAPFLLTNLLLKLIKRNAPSRIVNLSSIAHQRGKIDLDDLNLEKDYSAYSAYANSKLANVYFTQELAEILNGSGVTVNSLHPGVIDTKLLRTGFGASGASVESGAKTSVYLAVSEEGGKISGEYFVDSKKAPAGSEAKKKDIQKKLWETSLKMTSLEG